MKLCASIPQLIILLIIPLLIHAGEHPDHQRNPVSEAFPSDSVDTSNGIEDLTNLNGLHPSIYSSSQGGGFGDTRIFYRGIDQDNLQIQFDGIPLTSSMDNSINWYDWFVFSDNSLQPLLATPLGSSLSFELRSIPDHASGNLTQMIGSGSTLRSSFNYHSGLIKDRLKFSTSISRMSSLGIIDKTWLDAWTYKFDAHFDVGPKHDIQLFAMGSPQRHGLSPWKSNIATYDSTFAAGINSFSLDALEHINEQGRTFNSTWSPVSAEYTGEQFWDMYGAHQQSRYHPDFINLVENYGHKPLVFLKHLFAVSQKATLSNQVYWIGGSGGTSGFTGDPTWNYSTFPRTIDFDATIATNRDSLDQTGWYKEIGQSTAILKNTVDEQVTLGIISALELQYRPKLHTQFKFYYQDMQREQYNEVRDLLGGNFYIDHYNKNLAEPIRAVLGDTIQTYISTTAQNLGLEVTTYFESERLAMNAMLGYSQSNYTLQNHFHFESKRIASDALPALKLESELRFRINRYIDLFTKVAYAEKLPVLESILDEDGAIASSPRNERFNNSELGVSFNSQKLSLTTNLYQIIWKDLTLNKIVNLGVGSTGYSDILFLEGVNQIHQGLEIDATTELFPWLSLSLSLSLGNWRFEDDAIGEISVLEIDGDGNSVNDILIS